MPTDCMKNKFSRLKFRKVTAVYKSNFNYYYSDYVFLSIFLKYVERWMMPQTFNFPLLMKSRSIAKQVCTISDR